MLQTSRKYTPSPAVTSDTLDADIATSALFGTSLTVKHAELSVQGEMESLKWERLPGKMRSTRS